MAPINYAAQVGIKSFAAPVVFAILYFPLLVFFGAKAFVHHKYVFFILTLFSAIRVTAFILRALLSHVLADAENLNLLTAYLIIYNVGFFGLVYSAYILVTDRVAIAKNPPDGPISRLLRRRSLFRLILLAAVAIGITGSVESTSTVVSTVSNGDTLRRVATYIFLVCAILVLLQTFLLARNEFSETSYRDSADKIGATYGVYFLLVIDALLVAREVFFAATAKNLTIQDNESYWYPLAAVTEFLAVVLFATPGLVPQ